MGRKKINIERISDERNRQVTFNKRKNGLIKKAMELSLLCESSVVLIVVNNSSSAKERIFEYCSTDGDKHHLARYLDTSEPGLVKYTNKDYCKIFGKRGAISSDNDSDDTHLPDVTPSTTPQGTTSITPLRPPNLQSENSTSHAQHTPTTSHGHITKDQPPTNVHFHAPLSFEDFLKQNNSANGQTTDTSWPHIEASVPKHTQPNHMDLHNQQQGTPFCPTIQLSKDLASTATPHTPYQLPTLFTSSPKSQPSNLPESPSTVYKEGKNSGIVCDTTNNAPLGRRMSQGGLAKKRKSSD